MKKKFAIIPASILILFSFLAFLQPLRATTVFSDNFSTGDFSNWTRTAVSSGASQTVDNTIARFTVPTPVAGTRSYSYVVKDGFYSTVNSTIVASQDVLVTKVPNGCQQGFGAIFFLYVCDSTDLGGNNGNFGVGIDGSGVWSLWIGGNTLYNYVFQTAGSTPVGNTWYHLTLMIDNPNGLVTLAVNDITVINAGQQQFTNKTHPISLMTGMGEDWWSNGSGQQEVDIRNVKLEISDAAPPDNPTSTPAPTPLFTPSPIYTPIPTYPSTRSLTIPTSTPTLIPTQDPTSTPNSTLPIQALNGR